MQHLVASIAALAYQFSHWFWRKLSIDCLSDCKFRTVILLQSLIGLLFGRTDRSEASRYVARWVEACFEASGARAWLLFLQVGLLGGDDTFQYFLYSWIRQCGVALAVEHNLRFLIDFWWAQVTLLLRLITSHLICICRIETSHVAEHGSFDTLFLALGCWCGNLAQVLHLRVHVVELKSSLRHASCIDIGHWVTAAPKWIAS